MTRTSNNKNKRNRSNNSKGKSMAIAHVVMKSSSTGPSAAAHADYLARKGRYENRDPVMLLASGNMPEFAQADWRAFWVAADTHERVNGRTYTELQIALPRELGDAQRKELAMEATREFLGDRFAYTLAIHNPVAKDKIEQPHLHLMFSERVIDETTKALPEDKFFKRNGAKKDRETWHTRSKPEEVRTKWCEMMNRAMEREGIAARVDPRSWADQGRDDLDALKEPKMLGGDGEEAEERRKEIAELRDRRNELLAMHLNGAAVLQALEREAETKIAQIKQGLKVALSEIDRLIELARRQVEKFTARFMTGRDEKSIAQATAELVTIGLTETQVRLLIRSEWPSDLRQETTAMHNLYTGNEAVNVMSESVRLDYSEQRGFFAVLPKDVKPTLDAHLLRQTHLEREAPQPTRRPSRVELDQELRAIALASGNNSKARILPGEEVDRLQITARVLGYTSEGEEMLVERLGGDLVRVPCAGEPPLEIGKQFDINPRNGQTSRSWERG